jgi:hypothetical protein
MTNEYEFAHRGINLRDSKSPSQKGEGPHSHTGEKGVHVDQKKFYATLVSRFSSNINYSCVKNGCSRWDKPWLDAFENYVRNRIDDYKKTGAKGKEVYEFLKKDVENYVLTSGFPHKVASTLIEKTDKDLSHLRIH